MKTSTVEYLEKRIAPATIFVTNLLDDNSPGSLRKAIADANLTPAPDTIVFKPTAFGTIVLGGTDLDITTPMTIKGPGAGKVIINGNNASGILNIAYADNAITTATTVSGVALINGNGGNGGAIFSQEPLTVVNSIISGSTASDDGGGIYVKTDGKFTMSGTTVTGNTATDGGGLYLEVKGGISITKSIISGNTATVGKGGGAYISTNTGTDLTAKFLIKDTLVIGNSTPGDGGGLSIIPDERDITVINTIVTGNTAGGIGGGISMQNGTLQLKNSTLSGNTADFAGGIYIRVPDTKTSTITGTKILNNRATVTSGGGIQFDALGSATATLNILKSTIAGNSATTDGGGIAAENGGKLNLTGDTIFLNSATVRGGGVYTNGAAIETVVLTITGSTLSENTAVGGGGIFTGGEGAVTIAKSKLIANQATGGFGGGAYLITTNLVTITSTLITKNFATSGAGGLIVSSPNTILTSSTITDNVATGAAGGAYLAGASSTITKTLIRGNYAATIGGGLVIATTTNTIVKSIITGNIAKVTSGGIFRIGGNSTVDAATKLIGNIAPVNPDKNF